MKELLISVLAVLGLAWWIEITTESPSCTYYFGPFATAKEAKSSQSGYITDLEMEGAKGFKTTIKRCKPTQLTVFDEASESVPQQRIFPIFSGQL